MKQRYEWVVDAQNPATGMWSQVFKGNQPDMNRFLARLRLEGGANKYVKIRKRRVLKRRFVTRRED